MSFLLRSSAPHSRAIARHGAPEDAPAMGRVAYQTVGVPPETATEECARLLWEPFGFSAVVVRPGEPNDTLLAVLNGVLLDPGFSAFLRSADEPYFHRHVRAASHPFPTAKEVGRVNAGDGLDLFLGHFAVSDRLPPDEAIRVRGALVAYFAEHFAGNRLRSILAETVGWENTATALGGGFRALNTYPEWRDVRGLSERDGPQLLVCDLEQAVQSQNFHSVRLLQYRPPLFRFAPSDRELLRAARRGIADDQYAKMRGISPKSVGSAWKRMRERVEETMPSLFALTPHEGKSAVRTALLEHVHDHPEELWPYGPR